MNHSDNIGRKAKEGPHHTGYQKSYFRVNTKPCSVEGCTGNAQKNNPRCYRHGGECMDCGAVVHTKSKRCAHCANINASKKRKEFPRALVRRNGEKMGVGIRKKNPVDEIKELIGCYAESATNPNLAETTRRRCAENMNRLRNDLRLYERE